MGKGIVRVCDDPPRYVEWSTVSDSPATYALTPQELETYIREEYGREGLRDLPSRLARVSKTGTSFHGETPESVLRCNRAGPGETRLGSWAEVVARLDERRAQWGVV